MAFSEKDTPGVDLDCIRVAAQKVRGFPGLKIETWGTRQEERKTQDRFTFTLVIAASIIAAVRLAREDISTANTPRVISTVGDSVLLSKTILKRMVGI